MKVNADNRLPKATEPTLAYSLYAIFRDFARGINATELGGWRDLVGYPTIYTVGANDPTWVTYRGNIKQYKFSNAVMNEMWFTFHIDHDYKPQSDMYLHCHWSQITADASKQVKWYFDVSYAKGHQQAPFIAPITTSVIQATSAVQYQHMIAEVQLSAASPTAAQLNSTTLEVDGLIFVRIYRDAGDTDDTLTQEPFLHTVDIHYQADRMSTPNKAPNFYA